ncbi:hypothetical protein [Streptomyces sp. McG3]|uniref:hypothetical protein n=1 Tax=Streptomyces sp. McG3 TaxID=2725483 RepID=UPI002036FD9A|nr:hypothetical protein [Streptomyces sp. McG3]
MLLRRLRTVYVGEAGRRPGDPPTTTGLVALEAGLLDRGFALTPGLRTALASPGPAGPADTGKQLVRHIDAELGADRTHMPLFRGFPASVPDDTLQLYVDRVFTLLFQRPHQPCALCTTVGSVRPVAPCAGIWRCGTRRPGPTRWRPPAGTHSCATTARPGRKRRPSRTGYARSTG